MDGENSKHAILAFKKCFWPSIFSYDAKLGKRTVELNKYDLTLMKSVRNRILIIAACFLVANYVMKSVINWI